MGNLCGGLVLGIFWEFQILDLNMEGKEMLRHLQISKEAASCTLVTSLGKRVEVNSLNLWAGGNLETKPPEMAKI